METDFLGDEPTCLEVLQGMRPYLDAVKSRLENDRRLMASVDRLLEQERTGEVDDESELFYDDLTQVWRGFLRLVLKVMKKNGGP